MEQMTDQASFRRPINGYARAKSRFRGVIRNDATGKWLTKKEASKGCFLNSYETEEEAAVAFDMECIKQKGYQAITNYDLRCYDVEKILKTQQLIQQQQQATMLALQMTRHVTKQPQQPPKRPIACHLDLLPKNLATPDQRSHYIVWAQEAARKQLAKASSSTFQHGACSPFSSYKEVHGSSSTGELKLLIGPSQCSNKTQRIVPYGLLGPYQISLAMENKLKAQGLGFGHATSSYFKPYTNDNRNKGKVKGEIF